MSLRLTIADDHKICRVGLRWILEQQADFLVVGEADSAASALSLINQEQPDVAILDLRMRDEDGLSIVPSVLNNAPKTRILVLSMHDEPATVRRALAAGAHGYVNKAADPEEIVGGVRSVAAGRSFLSVPLERAGLNGFLAQHDVVPGPASSPAAARPGVRPLSEREREILQLFASGHTHRQIADRLGVRLKTVETYRSRLGDKFGVRSRGELVHCARELGLVAPV